MTVHLRAFVAAVSFVAIEAFGSDDLALEPLVMFSGSAVAPYGLYLGDADGWKVPADRLPVSSSAGFVTVEPNVEVAAPRLTWNGEGLGQVYLASAEPRDHSDFARADSALVILMKLHTRPGKDVNLRMGCGYPCAGDADVTRLLRWLPMDEWLPVAIDLACFVDLGLDPERVSTPFLLLTSGRLSLSVADVRLVSGIGDAATVAC